MHLDSNPKLIIALCVAVFIILQLFTRRYDIKWFFHKWYFGENHLMHRKNIWFANRNENYSQRELYVRNFMREVTLSPKETMQSLNLLSDARELTETHVQLLEHLLLMKKMESYGEKIFSMCQLMVLETSQWIKLRKYTHPV